MHSIRHRSRWILGVASAAVLGAAGAVAPVGSGGASDRAAKPQVTTLVDGQRSIQGFAQDGQWIVWADAGAPCHLQVKIRRAAGGPTRSLAVRKGPTCLAGDAYDGYQHRMALAGTRALWAVVRATSTRYEFAVRTSALNDGERELIEPAIQGEEEPFRPVPLAGDGDSLVYVDIHEMGEAGTGVGGGRIFRVGRRVEEVPGMSGTVAVAVSGPVLAAARMRLGCGCIDYPSWSPDGRRILFRSSRHDRDVSGLYVIDANGTNEQRLGVDASGAWSPAGGRVLLRDAAGAQPELIVVDLDRAERSVVARGPIQSQSWSPDGSRLAFASHDGLYAALADGSGLRRIVATKRLTGWAWSPDATRLAFVHLVGSQERLEVIAIDGRSRRIVGEASSIDSFEWAPTGAGIAYSPYTRDGRHPLRIVTADGSAAIELLGDDAHFYRWSPDGTRMAFTRFAVDRDDGLYIAAPDGSGRRRVSSDETAYLSWSPDGRQLAFVEYQGSDEVYAASADGSAVRRLGGFGELSGSPVWAPNSRRLAVVNSAGISIVALDGSVVNRIEKAESPAWSLDGQSLAYTVGELVIADADGAVRRVVTSTQPDPRPFRVDVRSLSTRAYLGRFPIDGQPLAVALSPLRVAVLVEGPAGKRIELHRLDGSLEQAVAVPRATSSELSMAGHWVVFRTGRTIHLLDARTGRRSVLALAIETPVGLSIEGRRVAWAEQTKPSRVRAILVPRA
jgi:Tol biopolymer transport system component